MILIDHGTTVFIFILTSWLAAGVGLGGVFYLGERSGHGAGVEGTAVLI